jgi:hypothetical protein
MQGLSSKQSNICTSVGWPTAAGLVALRPRTACFDKEYSGKLGTQSRFSDRRSPLQTKTEDWVQANALPLSQLERRKLHRV